MPNPLVVHCKKSPYDVYIGRGRDGSPGEWGNPFTMKHEGEREKVIRQYIQYLFSHPELVAKARTELKGKVLGCFCAPRPCHGDVLALVANASSTGTMVLDVLMEEIQSLNKHIAYINQCVSECGTYTP